MECLACEHKSLNYSDVFTSLAVPVHSDKQTSLTEELKHMTTPEYIHGSDL